MNLLQQIAAQKAAKAAEQIKQAETQIPAPVKKPDPLAGLIKTKVTNVAQASEPKQPAAILPAAAAVETKPVEQAKKPSILDSIITKPKGGIESAAKPTGLDSLSVTQPTANPAVTVTPKVGDIMPIPADVPDEQKIQVTELQQNLAFLIANIDDKDLIGPVVRNVLTKLQANPELCVFVPNLQWNQIVRGCRSSYKFEARKSDERKVAKVKVDTKKDKIAGQFRDLNFNI